MPDTGPRSNDAQWTSGRCHRNRSARNVIAAEEGALRLQVRDDGIRGARTDGNTGHSDAATSPPR
jgi:hypothetical protein